MESWICPECNNHIDLPDAPEGVKSATPTCGLTDNHMGEKSRKMIRSDKSAADVIAERDIETA